MKDWSNITILDYYNLIAIIRSENIDIELERTARLLAYVTGEEEEFYLNMPLRELQHHTKHIAFLSTGLIPGKSEELITVDNRKYKVCLDAFKLTAGQFIDIMEFIKDPDYMVKHLHSIMAVLCLPMKPRSIINKVLRKEPAYHKYCEVPFEEVSDQMLNARYIDCYHTAGFFLKVWEGCKGALKIYLTQKLSETEILSKTEASRTLTNLLSCGDGLTMPGK